MKIIKNTLTYVAIISFLCCLATTLMAAPTPNPAGFAVAPTSNGENSISMTATVGSAPNGPVEYLFTETSGNTGGSTSGWQISPSYVDSGLSTGTPYTYTVTLRDSEGSAGDASTPATATPISSDLFSVNFYAYGNLDAADHEAVTLESDESAGVGQWHTFGWSNYEVPWGLTSPATPVTLSSLSGASATLTINDLRNGGPYVWNTAHTGLPGEGNGDLMDGHANGTADPGDGSLKFGMTVGSIPFTTYDVLVYIGSNRDQHGDGKGKILFNGSEQDFTLPSGEFSAFTEITDATTPGNYIVFTGVTGASFTMQVWGEGAAGFNHIGPTGFQIRAAGPVADSAAPTPNAATFALAPISQTNGSIDMAATVGTDFSGPIEYLFTETSGNPGATSSSWQTNPTYTDSGLDASLLYTYTLTMRDAQGNTGTASAPLNAPAGFFTTLSISYDGNEKSAGTVPVDGTDHSTNDSVTVLGNPGTLTKTGYVFSGWNTTADGTGTTYNPGASFTITGDTTLYALWLQAYTVTFQAGDHGTLVGGTPHVVHTILDGFPCPTPPGVTPEAGYEFVTWNLSLPTTITEPLTVSAQYKLPAGDLKILVLGSTQSYYDNEKAYNPSAIASNLNSILSQDLAITDSVHVEFQDVYTSKVVKTAYGQGVSWSDITYKRNSLAQYFFWPEGKEARLANLRGEGDHAWDYVIISGDPYVMGNMPGMYAEGVRMIQREVAKGSAELVLLGQWPKSYSGTTTAQINEIAHRVGNSVGLGVVPAATAWEGLSDVSGENLQDTASVHPTPNGAYLAAASIYSKIFDRSASASGYRYPSSGDTIADHAFSVVQGTDPNSQYVGNYTSENPHQMDYATNRAIKSHTSGSSSESGMNNAIFRAMELCRLQTSGSDQYEFHHGRKGSTKGYRAWQEEGAFGYSLNHNGQSATVTCIYDIDKSDLGLGKYMIDRGEVPHAEHDVRAVPWRLLWSKLHHIQPVIPLQSDGWHASEYAAGAAGAYIVALTSGRCPVPDEPEDKLSAEGMYWLSAKIGYETAWQMSHLTARAPGFKVLPSAKDALTVTPSTSETMTVQFINPPQSDVTVSVSSSNPGAALVYPTTLVFTPENYNTPQNIRVSGIPGSSSSEAFSVNYATSSEDEAYNGHSDSWAYSTTRSSVETVTKVDRGVMPIDATQDFPEELDLQAAGSEADNTIILGPLHGSIEWTAPSTISYTAELGFTGKDEIFYVATVSGVQTTGRFDITVTAPDGQVNLSVSDDTAAEEGAATGSWTLTREGDTTDPLTVHFNLGGTATIGADYQISVPNPVTIPATVSSVTITLTPVDDAVSGEGSETAVLTISHDPAYSVGSTVSGMITISDNDTSAPLVSAGIAQTVAIHAGTPWTPGVIPTEFWLDATDASTLVLEGDNGVGQWGDKSGHEHHMSQPVAAAQPTYNPTGWGGTLPCLQMAPYIYGNTRNKQGLHRVVTDDVISGDAYTLFVVLDAADESQEVTIHNQGNIYGFGDAYRLRTTVHARQFRFLREDHGDPEVGTGSGVSTSGQQILQYTLADTNSEVRRDGVQIAANDGEYTAQRLSGLFTLNGNMGMTGSIAEFIFMAKNPSAADRQRVEGYLAHKWEMDANLAADHPYKQKPPMAGAVNLHGTVSDADGDQLIMEWSKISGPGPVTFADPSAADTTVSIHIPGDYVLRLSATDGTTTVSEDVTITISYFDIQVSETGGSTDVEEGGAEDTLTVVLNAAPSAEVSVSLTYDSQVTPSPDSLTFTVDNWNEAQTVTISAVDDALYEPVQEGVITLDTTSSDSFWNGLSHTLTAAITDNDSNEAPTVDAGDDQTVTLRKGVPGPDPAAVADAFYEWDAAQDTGGDDSWPSTGSGELLSSEGLSWTFNEPLSALDVADSRFDRVTKSYHFPDAKSKTSLDFSNLGLLPSTFEFVADIDGDGVIFAAGYYKNGTQIDVVDGVLRVALFSQAEEGYEEKPYEELKYPLTATDMDRFIHIVFVFDPVNSSSQLYVDGDLKASGAGEGIWCGASKRNGGLGTGSGAPSAQFETEVNGFTGKLALFRLYSKKTFTPAEVIENFSALYTGPKANVILDATVTDAQQTPATTWSVVSAPSKATIDDTSAVDTTVTMASTPGTYVLRLSADDGYLQASDEITITVLEDDGVGPHDVTYFGNGSTGGSVPLDGTSYGDGASVTVLGNTGNLTRTGHTFDGWNTLPNGSGTDYTAGATFTISAFSALSAQWNINSYTISFDSAGGTAIGDITLEYGTGLTAPANPTRAGFTFAGWNAALPTTMPAGSVNLTAQWIDYIPTLSFNSAGGSAVSSITGNAGAAVAEPDEPSREGYTFDGWNPALPATLPVGDETLTAQWTINSYTISFDGNGGATVGGISGEYGTAVTAPANPARMEHSFAGWSPAIPATFPANNLLLTAQWYSSDPTIHFLSDGGTAVDSITQGVGTDVTAPAPPTRAGYTFTGWNPAVPAAMPTGELYLRAEWSAKSYTISFNSTGGTEVADITQEYETAVTTPADPTRAGYSFTGWDPAFPTTMPLDGASLTAQWNQPPVVDAGDTQTVTLSDSPVVPIGFSYSPWTGDADSGIATEYNYTAAHSFGSINGGSVTVNDVAFTEYFYNAGTGWSLNYWTHKFTADVAAILTGDSEDLGDNFIYMPSKTGTVTFTELIPGKQYRATFFSLGWEDGTREVEFQTSGVSSSVINQSVYGKYKGIKISCEYVATAASQVFTVGGGGVFHLYAISNRVTVVPTATADLDGTTSDADGDNLTTNLSVISGPAAVDFANSSAVDTTATFTAEGSYVLRLTADDGYGPVSHDVTITVSLSSPPSATYTAWASKTFTNPFNDTDLNSDSDGDGRNNFWEFAFGTDPTLSQLGSLTADGSAHGAPIPVTDDGGTTFDFLFVRRDDHGTSGSLTYTVQFSSDLETFYESGDTPTVVADSSADADYEVVKLPFPATLPNGQKATFGRVMVVESP